MKNDTIRGLIKLIRNNDYYSFQKLLSKYRDILKGYSFFIPASDSYEELESYFCELILKLNLDNFENDKAIRSYINISLKRFMWRRSNYYVKNNIFKELQKNNLQVETIDENLMFYDIIRNLDEKSKKLITLRYKSDMTYKKISNLYGESPQNIKKKLKK
ncbi:sigma-70 family RNA polymerase sigma factor [Clostridium massiliamazoniense]|uniref:sigma-70 family RNA polymerase sigma factor n=1 Tax=Clostridium massiliamazoniense TaxID=1347366 RepID=UPI0006D78E5E|nr:sigma-70 family RNA polymerase sigma factor [Clostridium massiliamazoniense]